MLVNIVVDIGGNIAGELDNIAGGALFLKLILKLVRNEYSSKLEKEFRFQIIHTSNISYFPGFSLDF